MATALTLFSDNLFIFENFESSELQKQLISYKLQQQSIHTEATYTVWMQRQESVVQILTSLSSPADTKSFPFAP